MAHVLKKRGAQKVGFLLALGLSENKPPQHLFISSRSMG
jgi:hypothetical protein